MKILLHICCGPCATYPVQKLRQDGHEPLGYFYNPNIHPFREFKNRLKALEELSRQVDLKVDYERDYGLTEYLRQVVFNEEKRCLLCYRMRLEATVRQALEIGAESFSTTLLYSRYQNHELIKAMAEKLAAEHGLVFYYEDFRQGWQEGIDLAVAKGLYRQAYCGCIYSEQERYDKKFQQRKKKES